MTLNTNSLGQFTDLVKRSYTKTQELLPQVMRNSPFVITDVMPKGTGDFKRFSQRLTRSQYAGIRGEGDESGQGEVQYGYEKDANPYTVSMQVSITKRMRDAGKDRDILDQVTRLSEVCPNTMDLDLAHRFAFAWESSYVRSVGVGASRTIDTTTGDGLSLINAAHTLTGSGTTYSNQVTSNPAFSESALETAEKSFVEETYDNLGKKINAMPDTILTTDDPNTCNEVKKLLNATADVGSANSATFNPYRQKYTHIKSHRIATDAQGASATAKSKYWFLIDSGMSDMYLSILNEPYLKTPEAGNNGENFSTETWSYLTAADYDISVVSGVWVRGSKGDAS